MLLLNLLIALLLEDYNNVNAHSRAYFLQQILSLDDLWHTDPYYGALTFKQGPLVIFNFSLIPLIYLRLKFLNKFLEIVMFVPSFLLSLMLFILLDAAYFLLSYVYIFPSLFNSPGSSPCRQLWKGIGLFFLYPFLLIPTLFRDAIVFSISVFSK